MYNFIYSSSNEYAPFCMTSMCSLLENNEELENVKFWILSNGICQRTMEQMSRLCRQHSADIEFIDCDGAIRRIFENGGKLNFNPSSFLRIFIPELLPEQVDKALFIDSDTYINTGIKELYDIDLSDFYCAMSYNQPIYQAMLHEAGFQENEGYFNAGIILMNLEAWRKIGIQEKILEYYYANGGDFPTDDQSVINAIVGKKTKVLPYCYNAMIGNFYWSYDKFCSINTQIGCKSREEYLKARSNPVIIHFNGPGVRPWEKWCAHPYTKTYRKLLKRCNPDYAYKMPRKGSVHAIAQFVKHVVFDKIERIIHDGQKNA